MNKFSLKEKLIIGIAILLGVSLLMVLLSKFALAGLLIFGAIILAFGASIYIFRNPEFGWLLIVFFLPFERFPTLNLGGVDLKINTVLGFITLLGWVLALMFNPKRYKVQPYAITLPIVLFISAMLISLTQAQNMSRALEVLVFTLFTMAFSILATNMINSKEALKKTVQVILLAGLVVSLYGIFQFAGNLAGLSESAVLLKEGYGAKMMGFPRVMAFSMEPLYLANFLLIPIFLALAFFFNKVDIWPKKDGQKPWWKLPLYLGFLVLILVLTVSRGAYLGFGAAFLVMAILLFRKVFTFKNVALFLIGVVVIGYAVAFGLSKGDPTATNNFITHALVRDYAKDASVQERLTTYKAALDAYHHRPVFGVGIGNYGPWLAHFSSAPPDGGWLVVNNEFLEVLAETGLVGLICFGILLVFLIYRSLLAIKYAQDPFFKTVMIGLFAAFIGVLVQYNFFSTLYIIHIWVLIGLLVASQTLILKSRRA